MTDEPEQKAKPLTRAQLKLLDAGDVIFAEAATEKEAAYMARELVQATLPHKNPGNVEAWTRKNGNLTLAMQPGFNIKENKSYGYPFGTIPRLVLFWITSEAIKTKSRRLDLGSSLAGFMHELGLNPDTGGGKRGDAKRLRDQMERLFNARISFQSTVTKGSRRGEARINMTIAGKSVLWWSEKDPNQTTLWGSWVELGQDFYEAITAAPVPVDIRALKALKSSALALDLYSLLTYEAYRAQKSGKERFISWENLHSQLGADYSTAKNFATKARAALRKIGVVYPTLQLGSMKGGLTISAYALPAINTRERVTIDGETTP